MHVRVSKCPGDRFNLVTARSGLPIDAQKMGRQLTSHPSLKRPSIPQRNMFDVSLKFD